jgi:hypothetical protein
VAVIVRIVLGTVLVLQGSADTEAACNYEYTSWNDVRHFAEE